jgi:hypothetical protein
MVVLWEVLWKVLCTLRCRVGEVQWWLLRASDRVECVDSRRLCNERQFTISISFRQFLAWRLSDVRVRRLRRA